MAEVLGATIEENRRLWELASPVTHVTADDPPFLILHGLQDATVDYLQSQELAGRLAEVGVPHQLELIDGIGHTFHLDAWGKKPMPPHIKPLVLGFFDRHLRASP
jgi:acetyl esterase/lipase